MGVEVVEVMDIEVVGTDVGEDVICRVVVVGAGDMGDAVIVVGIAVVGLVVISGVTFCGVTDGWGVGTGETCTGDCKMGEPLD
jgi:hypothetical protein